MTCAAASRTVHSEPLIWALVSPSPPSRSEARTTAPSSARAAVARSIGTSPIGGGPDPHGQHRRDEQPGDAHHPLLVADVEAGGLHLGAHLGAGGPVRRRAENLRARLSDT